MNPITIVIEKADKIDNDIFIKQWSAVKGANQELINYIKYLISQSNKELLEAVEESFTKLCQQSGNGMVTRLQFSNLIQEAINKL